MANEIIINPIFNGECFLNVTQTIYQGAKLTVQTGKTLRITGN